MVAPARSAARWSTGRVAAVTSAPTPSPGMWARRIDGLASLLFITACLFPAARARRPTRAGGRRAQTSLGNGRYRGALPLEHWLVLTHSATWASVVRQGAASA